jgi:hypothetical protein
MNNKLIIFFEDGSNEVLFFDEHTREVEALDFFKKSSHNRNKSIKQHFYTKDLKIPLLLGPSDLKLQNGKVFFDPIESLKFSKIRNIKEVRNSIIKSLDVPFMMALERNDEKFKNYIISLKNFLRDLPDNLRMDELKTAEEISRYNPFNNILRIIIINAGEGYLEPPAVEIEPPADFFIGSPAKALAFIDGGKVVRIEITDQGSGYINLPKISIAPPPSGKQALAACLAIENMV